MTTDLSDQVLFNTKLNYLSKYNTMSLFVGNSKVMILTVGKVFLYDASELEGLFHVVSFFGLGLSLSWFYTQFVFGKHDLLEGFKK